MAATVLDTAHSCLARLVVTMTSLGPGDVMIRCRMVLWLTWFAASPQPIHLRVGLHSRLVWLYRCFSSRGPEFVVRSRLRFPLKRWRNFTNLCYKYLQNRCCRTRTHAHTHTHTHTHTPSHFIPRPQKKKAEKYLILKICITETNEHAPPDRSVAKQVCVAVQINLYTLVTFTDKMSMTHDTKASSVALPACHLDNLPDKLVVSVLSSLWRLIAIGTS